MNKCFMLFFGCVLVVVAAAQEKMISMSIPDTSKKIIVTEVACGECQFNMRGNGCDLAVRINDVCYFVDGTDIDAHGDAHEKNGFCNAIKTANVQGEVKNGRFAVTYFQLQPNIPAGKTLKRK